MKWSGVAGGTAACGAILWPRVSGRSVWRGRVLCSGLVSAFLAAGRGVAQTPSISQSSGVPGRLTVRPREMAMATQTAQAGRFSLDSVPRGQWPKYLVYVPPQCIGTRRCPLVVDLGTYLRDEQDTKADKYGMILLHLPADVLYDDNHYFRQLGGAWSINFDSTGAGLRQVDSMLQQTLHRFAIDPDKIAVIGKDGTVPAAALVGGKNLDVFSRIVLLSGTFPTEWVDPPNTTTEFLVDYSILEDQGFETVQALRRAGHRVKQVSGLRAWRGDYRMNESYDFLGWLHDSWATPNPAARPAPQVVADPLPVLTTEALAKMATFWKSFLRMPDQSIRTTVHRAHLREVAVPLGEEQVSVMMVDMPALAAQYPSVAVALEQVGLTVQQHEAYRVALLSARLLLGWRWESGGGPSRGVLGVQAENLAFVSAHWEEPYNGGLNDFWVTGLWDTP